MRLGTLAPGKVNLCLFVGERRPDGRHEVVTLLQSVSVADELSLTTLEDSDRDDVSCPGVDEANIVLSALEGLRARGWSGPKVRVEISKRIPIAAGMGGGSADAAATLRLARELAPVSDRAIAELAAELGADVPSQLQPGLAVGTGVGDQVNACLPLGLYAYVIVPLPRRLATADVYAEADRLGVPRPPDELARKQEELRRALTPDARLPDELLVNDLQPAAVSLCPEITGALDAVRDAGADHAMVSGSGPTVFGLLAGEHASERAQAAAGSLVERFSDASSAVPVASEFGHPRRAAQSGE